MKAYLGRRDTERAAVMVEAGVIRPDSCNAKAAVYKCPFGNHWHVTKLDHGEEGE